MIRLSIIIPFYNVEQYIAQCLDSVYNQDIPEEEYEVVCVDDCGPDNSIAIVEQYAKKHSNLIVVRNKENRKLGGARNAGMEVASGKYVWYIDSDDFIEPNVFGRLLEEVEKNDLDVLHFNYEWYPDRNNPDNHRVADTEIMTGTDMFFDKRFVWFHDLVTAWRKLYRRSFLLEHNIVFAEHIMFEDNDYAIRVFADAKRVKHISLNAYSYRSNPESITHVNHTDKHVFYWLDLAHRLVRIKDEFGKSNKDFRFQSLLDGFIRFEISNTLKVYDTIDVKYKSAAKNVIRKSVDVSLRKYMSKSKYIRIKLGII